jgi:hypothetical protein
VSRVRYFFFGAVAGAAGLYLLDPISGRRRRALLRDKTNKFIRQAGDGFEVGWRDLQHRVQGVVAELRHRISETPGMAPNKLQARVASQLGRVVSHPHEVHVSVEGDEVRLTGRVPADEISCLMAKVQAVPGVGKVNNQLEVCEDCPPELRRETAAQRRRNLPPAAKLIAAGAGGILLAKGLARGGLRGALGIASGLAATACALSRQTQAQQTQHRDHMSEPPVEVPQQNAPAEELNPIPETPLVPAVD